MQPTLQQTLDQLVEGRFRSDRFDFLFGAATVFFFGILMKGPNIFRMILCDCIRSILDADMYGWHGGLEFLENGVVLGDRVGCLDGRIAFFLFFLQKGRVRRTTMFFESLNEIAFEFFWDGDVVSGQERIC